MGSMIFSAKNRYLASIKNVDLETKRARLRT